MHVSETYSYESKKQTTAEKEDQAFKLFLRSSSNVEQAQEDNINEPVEMIKSAAVRNSSSDIQATNLSEVYFDIINFDKNDQQNELLSPVAPKSQKIDLDIDYLVR